MNTRLELPESDDTVAALDPESRRLIAEGCARRAQLELLGGAAFTMVTQALFDLGAETEIIEMSARAVEQELRHSEIYLHLASVYAGHFVEAPRARPIRQPVHPGVSPALQAALRIVGMCAVNETMACAFLELCRTSAKGPLVRAAIHSILEDEVHHAQIGWAFLGSARLGKADKALLSPWLVTLLSNQWEGWRSQIGGLPQRAFPEHGCPSPEAIEEVALDAIERLVLPGFRHVGLDATEAARWFADLRRARCGAAGRGS